MGQAGVWFTEGRRRGPPRVSLDVVCLVRTRRVLTLLLRRRGGRYSNVEGCLWCGGAEPGVVLPGGAPAGGGAPGSSYDGCRRVLGAMESLEDA
jgi:hypothetical protein